MRFFFLNIKRNILYKSKHKGPIMKRGKTSHELQGVGYSIFLFMWWQKHEIQVPEKTGVKARLPSSLLPTLQFCDLQVNEPGDSAFQQGRDQIRVHM